MSICQGSQILQSRYFTQRTWEELIQTQDADLLSAIPLMAHALRSNDRDLQLLYCSLLECQRDLQQTSDALHTHINLNVSIAREISGHPGCQSLVRLSEEQKFAILHVIHGM